MGHLRVLIVEDEVLLALNAADIIKDAGHAVVGTAQEKASAFELAAGMSPNLALVDLNLQDGLTGPEIGVTLATRHQIPVLFVTGHVALAPLSYPGIIGVISKPYSAERLTDALSFIATHTAMEWESAPRSLWTSHFNQ